MNRNLYNKELKRNRKNLFIWSGIAVAFTFMITSLYPTFQNAGQAMMDAMPKEMTKAFGMDMAEWKHIMGYYKTYYGFHIILIMSIYACSCGANIISKEEREKTSEFLFSKPISRKTIFISKTLALITLVFLIFAHAIIGGFGLYRMKVRNTVENPDSTFTPVPATITPAGLELDPDAPATLDENPVNETVKT